MFEVVKFLILGILLFSILVVAIATMVVFVAATINFSENCIDRINEKIDDGFRSFDRLLKQIKENKK